MVTNHAGSVTGSNALLTVATSPIITVQPTNNQSMAMKSTATLTVTAVGIAPLSYQWQINGTNLVDGTNPVYGDITSGSTNNVLTFSNAQTNNSATNYTVVVTNIDGSVTSSVAALTVTNVPPTIGTQPMSQTVWVGSTVTFSVSGTANDIYTPYFLQWQKDGTDLTNGLTVGGSTISGATATNVLNISNVQTTDSGNYALIITNAGGSMTSSNAVLTVLGGAAEFREASLPRATAVSY